VASVLTRGVQVLAWGRNDVGQLGLGYACSQVPLPTIVSFEPASVHIVKVASGHSHCLALSASGAVYAWGTNRCAQCGCDPASVPAVLRPTLIEPPPDDDRSPVPMRDIGGGHEFSFAISRSDSLYTWGALWLSHRDALARAHAHSFARSFARTGANNFRQLGIADCMADHVPHATAVLHGVRKVGVGADNIVAVMLDGRALAWGRKRWGKCGTGDQPHEWDDYKTASPDEMAQHWVESYAHCRPQPVQGDIASLTCVDVVCGGNHTLLRVRDDA